MLAFIDRRWNDKTYVITRTKDDVICFFIVRFMVFLS